MTSKTLGLAFAVLGIIVLAVSLSADLLGLGARAGIGGQQLSGAVAGALLLLTGIWFRRRAGTPSK
jgi:hypothetical protein